MSAARYSFFSLLRLRSFDIARSQLPFTIPVRYYCKPPPPKILTTSNEPNAVTEEKNKNEEQNEEKNEEKKEEKEEESLLLSMIKGDALLELPTFPKKVNTILNQCPQGYVMVIYDQMNDFVRVAKPGLFFCPPGHSIRYIVSTRILPLRIQKTISREKTQLQISGTLNLRILAPENTKDDTLTLLREGVDKIFETILDSLPVGENLCSASILEEKFIAAFTETFLAETPQYWELVNFQIVEVNPDPSFVTESLQQAAAILLQKTQILLQESNDISASLSHETYQQLSSMQIESQNTTDELTARADREVREIEREIELIEFTIKSKINAIKHDIEFRTETERMEIISAALKETDNAALVAGCFSLLKFLEEKNQLEKDSTLRDPVKLLETVKLASTFFAPEKGDLSQFSTKLLKEVILSAI